LQIDLPESCCIRKSSGKAILKPALDLVLESEDTLIVMCQAGIRARFYSDKKVKPSRGLNYRGASG
jgi:hypothetical protein